MISDESNSNDPNIDIDEDSVGLTQDAEINRHAEYSSEMINDDESVSPINEEEEMTNMQDLDEAIKMFPEEANNEYLM